MDGLKISSEEKGNFVDPCMLSQVMWYISLSSDITGRV